ncbi:hypothetical protein ROZALSC1DRAFT_24798, partial [Rozella allomycis CSF55]
SLIALVILTRVPQTNTEDNLSNNSFSVEVPVQQVPTTVADKESAKPIADDALETDSLVEIDYDEDVEDISPEIDTSKVIDRLRATLGRLKNKLAALVAVHLAAGPSESLDRDINARQEEISQSTRGLELLDDALESRNNEGPVPISTPTVIAQVLASEQKDQKVISAVHKLYPKMDLKPSDLNNIEEYLPRFERIYKDNNLNTEQPKHLLRLFAHNNESVAHWLTRQNKLNQRCNWDVPKTDLLKEFLAPYWKSENVSKIFQRHPTAVCDSVHSQSFQVLFSSNDLYSVAIACFHS